MYLLLLELPHYIGLVAGVCTSFSLLPQLIKMIKEKKVDDISFFMLLTLLVGLGLWVYYGILRTDWPIIITNSFSFLLNGTMIVLRIRYKRRKLNS
ncbi:MAG: SemiSWEET transporter [Chitinophagaceae bacterium]|nr:SemiSWEET transporter [Chitinophagaceae bacterium]